MAGRTRHRATTGGWTWRALRMPGFTRPSILTTCSYRSDSARVALAPRSADVLQPWPALIGPRWLPSRAEGYRRNMKNFARALRHAWPYRGRLLISVVCALMAAVLWGGNFTSIYP